MVVATRLSRDCSAEIRLHTRESSVGSRAIMSAISGRRARTVLGYGQTRGFGWAGTLLAILVASLSLWLTGCAPQSKYMREVESPQQLQAPPNGALVVFIRPSKYAGLIIPTIMDGKGRYLGSAVAGSHFAIRVPPGEHLFISWGENTGVVLARVAAGHIYYVHVEMGMGAITARTHLVPIKPSMEEWQELPEWLADTTRLVPKQAKGQAYLDSKKRSVKDRIARAKDNLTEADPDELLEMTLAPTDGVHAPGGSPLEAAAAAPQPTAAEAPAPAAPARPAKPATTPPAYPKDKAALSKIAEAREQCQKGELTRAESLLLGIVKACGADCRPSTLAQAWMLVGVTRGKAGRSPSKVREAFNLALGLDAQVVLDTELATEETAAMFRVIARARQGQAQPSAAQPAAQ